MREAVHFVPIATSIIALVFAVVLGRRYRERGGTHLAWWCAGMVVYAAGTITESITTLFGWSEPVFKAWYISGALLGGAPLAQGTAYLLVAAVAVVLAPIRFELVESHRLSGRVFGWPWVRRFSPFINLYAVILLVGGAILSAWRYRHRREARHRFLGNVAIAIGGILPGIGGTFTRFGHVEVLYVTELIGLLVIWAGYRLNTQVSSGVIEPERARPAMSVGGTI
jgi:hypothetical protein